MVRVQQPRQYLTAGLPFAIMTVHLLLHTIIYWGIKDPVGLGGYRPQKGLANGSMGWGVYLLVGNVLRINRYSCDLSPWLLAADLAGTSLQGLPMASGCRWAHFPWMWTPLGLPVAHLLGSGPVDQL